MFARRSIMIFMCTLLMASCLKTPRTFNQWARGSWRAVLPLRVTRLARYWPINWPWQLPLRTSDYLILDGIILISLYLLAPPAADEEVAPQYPEARKQQGSRLLCWTFVKKDPTNPNNQQLENNNRNNSEKLVKTREAKKKTMQIYIFMGILTNPGTTIIHVYPLYIQLNHWPHTPHARWLPMT